MRTSRRSAMIETSGAEHAADIVGAIEDAGYEVETVKRTPPAL